MQLRCIQLDPDTEIRIVTFSDADLLPDEPVPVDCNPSIKLTG